MAVEAITSDDGYEYRALVVGKKVNTNTDIKFYVYRHTLEELLSAVETYRRVRYGVTLQRRRITSWNNVDFKTEARLEDSLNDPRM